MKKLLYIFILIGASVGCQSKYLTYSDDNGVFFYEKKDTTNFSFTFVDGAESSQNVNVIVNLIGTKVNYDREFKIKVVTKNCQPGVDFEPVSESQIIKAGAVAETIVVTLKRTDELKDGEKFLTLELLENENFSTNYKVENNKETNSKDVDKCRHTVVFSELMTAVPVTWNEYYFGMFSYKKFVTICEVMNISRTKFLDTSYMSFGRKAYIAQKMKQYFIDEKDAGRTVYEDDNKTEMSMGEKI